MINLRIYRASLLLVPVAIVIAMFSLRSDPPGQESPTAPDTFDGAAAASKAKELNRLAPSPRPGSDADAELADTITEEFTQIRGAQVARQEFEGSFDGDSVDLVNVICVLPGETDEQLVMIAARDSARGDGAAAAASTAAMLQIAAGFGGITHRKTLVFVSTTASTAGAQGVREFAQDYSDISRVSSVLVLSNPAAGRPTQPRVIPWSTGPQSTSIELERSAEVAVRNETNAGNRDEGAFSELARLAIPVNLGEQGPLIESGIDAVRIASKGERQVQPGADEDDDIRVETLSNFGRASLALVLTLDAASEPLQHGPGAYIGVFGNLLPGWALALISLSLVVPLALVALAAAVRGARRPEALAGGAAWTLTRSLPALVALLVTYFLGFITLLPRPAFPYDPGRFPVGLKEEIALVLVALSFAAGLWVVKPWRRPPASVGGGGAAAACATLIALTGLGIWLANPYLALLVVPALHAWLLLLAESTAVGSLLALGITLIGLVPLFAALAVIAGHLDVGRGVFWQLFLLLGNGQISPALALLGCLAAGCGLSALALARSRIYREPKAPKAPEISISRG
jgi:hypothetical protein